MWCIDFGNVDESGSNLFIIEFRTRLMRRLDEERALKSKFE